MNGHGVSSNEITSIDDFEIDIKPSLLEGDVEEQQLQQQPSMISNWSIAPPEHQQQQQQNDHSPQTQPITSDPSSSSPSPATTPVPAQQVPTKLKRSKSSEGGNKPSKKRATLTPLPSIASSGSPSRASGSPKRVSLTNSKSPLLDEDEDEEDCSCPITYCQTCGRRRARWTNALHQKFLAALEKLGMKAVPSELLQEMNVPHLTREQVASHLQKFRRKYPIDKATSQPNWNSIKTKEESHSSKTNSPPMLSSTKSSSTKATKKSSTSKPKVKKEKTSLKTSSSAVVPSAPSSSPSVSPVTVQPAPAVPLRTSSQAVLPSLPAPPTVHPQQQQAQQQQQRTSISYQIPTVPAELPPIENSQWDVNSDPFVRSMQDLVWYVDNNNGNSNNTGVAGTSAGYPPMTQTPQYTPTNNYSPSYYSQPASSPQGFSPNYHPTFSAMPHLPQQQQPSQPQHSQRPPYFPTHQQQPPPQLQQFQQPPPLQPQFQQQQQQHPSQHTQPQRQHQQQHQLHQQLNLGYPPS